MRYYSTNGKAPVADLRKAYEDFGYIEDGEDNDDCFEIYEDGYYAHNHASVTIREADINLPEPQRAVLVAPPAGMEEIIDVRLGETTFLAAYKEKMDELREQGAFEGDDEARIWLRQNPIVLELVYEKHHGLFAVESDALGSGCVRSPYTDADVVTPEE